MNAQKPTAVIDKSLFQEICSQPEEQRRFFWKELSDRYKIVIPFILVEEIWINYARPGAKDTTIISEMVNTLSWMSGSWMDDVDEIVFKELIQKKRPKTLPPPAQNVIELLCRLSPHHPTVSVWLEQRSQFKKHYISKRKQFYDQISPTGKFLTIKNETELFTSFAWELFMLILDSKDGGKNILEELLGWQFRNRHSNFKRRIEKAFSNYTKETFKLYPATFNYLITDIFYFYAPLCRIQDNPGADLKKIIGRKTAELRNNPEDQKYVVSAGMCDRLLTRDEGMGKIMQVIKKCGLWDGEIVLLDPRKPLSGQIPNLLA